MKRFSEILSETSNSTPDLAKGRRVALKHDNKSYGPGVVLQVLKGAGKVRVMFDKDNPDLDDVDPKFYDIKPEELVPLTEEFDDSRIIRKIGTYGYNNSDGWVDTKNSDFKARNLWCLTLGEKSYWGSAARGVYRWYHLDNPNPGNATGLVKVDMKALTVQVLDQQKMGDSDKPLVWGRKLSVKYLTIFKDDFEKDQ